METKKTQVGILAVAVILAGVVGYSIGASNQEKVVGNEQSGMHHAMDGMMSSLEGKTGDALDRAFLSEMIVHHEGAVEMAQAVLQGGAHVELKQMAEEIISAQTAEIAQMRSWQKSWYGE